MRKIVFLLVTLLVLLSCNNGKSRFLFAVHETDFVNKSKITVKGTPVDVELPLGVSNLAICDSFFIVMFYNGGPLMNVYSLDWDLLGRFCYKGRAKNEFLDVFSLKNFSPSERHEIWEKLVKKIFSCIDNSPNTSLKMIEKL